MTGPSSPQPSPSWVVRTVRFLTDPRRRTVVVLASIATIGLVVFGVYATTDGPPPKVEAVVYFAADATQVQREAVRTACPTVGRAVQEPPDRDRLATSRVYPLRYDITGASTADRAALFRCVEGRPKVVGISQFTQGQ